MLLLALLGLGTTGGSCFLDHIGPQGVVAASPSFWVTWHLILQKGYPALGLETQEGSKASYSPRGGQRREA